MSFSSKDPAELVSQFVDILLDMTGKKYRAAVEWFKQLEQLKVQEMDHLEESSGAGLGFPDSSDDDLQTTMIVLKKVLKWRY